MVADLWQKEGKISACFKNSTSVVLHQFEHKVGFSKKGFYRRIKMFSKVSKKQTVLSYG